jgi:hypothetical protein
MSSTGHQSRALYVPERLTYGGGLYMGNQHFLNIINSEAGPLKR